MKDVKKEENNEWKNRNKWWKLKENGENKERWGKKYEGVSKYLDVDEGWKKKRKKMNEKTTETRGETEGKWRK